VIHLYALTAEPPASVGLVGVDGAPVTTLAAGALVGVTSEHRSAPEVTADNALAHAAVVAAVADQVPTLPVRFGTHHRDHAALREALAETEDELLATLARIGHAVEYVVRAGAGPAASQASAPAPADDSVGQRQGPGRRYLEERLAEQHAAEAAEAAARARVAAATAGLDTLAIAIAERVGRSGPERCFLVDRDATAAFAAAAAAATEDGLVVGGPWPPFTFAAEVTR
jgi:hypothetical protein